MNPISETTNGKLLSEHMHRADGDPTATTEPIPKIDWIKIATKLKNLAGKIDGFIGGGSSSDGCVKPKPWASSSAWAAYSSCKAANTPVSCPDPSAISLYNSLINNPDSNGNDIYDALIYLTGDGTAKSYNDPNRGLIMGMDREVAYFAQAGDIANGNCVKKNQDLYKDYATRLYNKLQTIMPKPCNPGFHWNEATHSCVADNCAAGQYWDATAKACVAKTCPTGQHLDAGFNCVADTKNDAPDTHAGQYWDGSKWVVGVKPNWFVTPTGMAVTGGSLLAGTILFFVGKSKGWWFAGK